MLKTIFNLIVIFVLLTGIAGCGEFSIDENVSECKSIHFNDGWYDIGPEGADTRVLDHRIDGDCLYLKVGYGGGCKTHDIQLAATGWIKTLPPQIDAKVIHDDQDPCEAYIQEEVGFDLGYLGDEKEFYINLKGLDHSIHVKRN